MKKRNFFLAKEEEEEVYIIYLISNTNRLELLRFPCGRYRILFINCFFFSFPTAFLSKTRYFCDLVKLPGVSVVVDDQYQFQFNVERCGAFRLNCGVIGTLGNEDVGSVRLFNVLEWPIKS